MTVAPTTFALAGRGLIILVFMVVMFFAFVFAYYTRKGSDISQRPSDGRGEAPGADGASDITTADDDADERTLGTHGTR